MNELKKLHTLLIYALEIKTELSKEDWISLKSINTVITQLNEKLDYYNSELSVINGTLIGSCDLRLLSFEKMLIEYFGDC